MIKLPTLISKLALLGFALVLAACNPEPAGPQEPSLRTIDWAEPLEVARGPAYRGPWRMNESEFFYLDDPAVVLADGGGYVAWADNEAQDIFVQRFAENGSLEPDEPVNVSGNAGTFSWLPRLATGQDGQVLIAAWQEILFTGGSHGGEILLSRSRDGGRSFSEPVNLSNTTAGAGKGRRTRELWDNGSLDLAFGPEGRLYVAWTEYQGALKMTWSDNQGESFAEPVRIAGDESEPARAPAVATGPDGRVWLAWTFGNEPEADIHLAFSDRMSEGFSDPATVQTAGGNADAPAVAVGCDGTIHLVYTVDAGRLFQDSRIAYTASDGDGAEFSRPLIISRFPDTPEAVAAYPQLAVAGPAVVVAWEHAPRSRYHPLGLGYAVSGDGGQHFSQPRIVPGTDDPAYGRNGGGQGLLMRKLDIDDTGRVALGHATWLDGKATHIRLFRGRLDESRGGCME